MPKDATLSIIICTNTCFKSEQMQTWPSAWHSAGDHRIGSTQGLGVPTVKLGQAAMLSMRLLQACSLDDCCMTLGVGFRVVGWSYSHFLILSRAVRWFKCPPGCR